MAHFRAVIKGSRGEASRLGGKQSGISTLLQTWGWNVRVRAQSLGETDTALIDLVHSKTGRTIRIAGIDLTTGMIHNYCENCGSNFRNTPKTVAV